MNAKGSSNLTVLDRRVAIHLQNPDQTPSAKHDILPATERLQRLHGTSLIWDVSKQLSLGASTFATACTIFHRFYHQVSLQECDVWSVAMASTLLSTKIEEQQHTLKAIIHAYCQVFRRRVLVATPLEDPTSNSGWDWDHGQLAHVESAKKWGLDQKEKALEQLPLPMKLGPVYEEWHKQISNTEAKLLKQLGFILYWIPDSHPHKFLLYFCQVMELTNAKFVQRAWNYCNDSCRLDLSVRYTAEVIASAAILLAARDYAIDLPLSPRPWWDIFVGSNKSLDLATAANAILGLCSEKNETVRLDYAIASKGFVKSMVPGGSFNDPDSFLWDQLSDAFRQLPTNPT